MEMDKEDHINETNNSSNAPNVENMSPKELCDGLRKYGIKTRVRNVKRLQEMFLDALNTHAR